MTAGIGSSPPTTRPTDKAGIKNGWMDGWMGQRVDWIKVWFQAVRSEKKSSFYSEALELAFLPSL